MAKAVSPFAGLKLTEQSPLTSHGTDQRLFAAPPPPPPDRPKRLPVPKDYPGNLGTLEPTKQARKLGTLEPRKLEQKDQAEREALFDINREPFRNNTFIFTEEELWALEDTKVELKRKYELRATKYDLIRCGLHMLIEDYRQNKDQSFIVERLRKKKEH